MRNKVTIQDIADFTGVSKFAVSRALAGKTGVSEQTRSMIIKAAGQLGYFKEPLSDLPGDLQDPEAMTWTGTVLVLFPNVRYQNKDSVYWGPVFEGISARLNQKGLTILTLTEPSGDSVFSLLNPQAIKGILTVGSVSTAILLEIKRLGIPTVMVDHLDPAFPCDCLFADNLSSMREMVAKLIQKGYKSYQFVGNITDAHSYYERWLGFRSALEDFGVELQQWKPLIGPELDQFETTFLEAIDGRELPDVFVCANDYYAITVLDVLKKRHGGAVPASCAVTGFDNVYSDHPILATVDVNKELIGMRAVDQLLRRIVNPGSHYEKTLLQADVIFRD
ncbi:LacI family DNA-binding transcriptional regulator [Paenibacillus thailandensis]|uniref:LacI family DNA-binding transcriptional regulator n=1 Tax=Paenibacillus thailandensis TaxID=393250 RepID=A0ABW5QTE4_9BACL